MFFFILFSNVLLGSAYEQDTAAFFDGGQENRNIRGISNMRESFSNPLTYNSTYIDKADNLLRVPSKYYEEPKTKKKIKKSPKRTVQKIIKKNKFKNRKLYLYPASIVPTLETKSDKEENNAYTRYDTPTTEPNFKKKSRKNSKYVRYPMPFQNLHRKDGNHNRYRREDRDAFILKDFDEIEFLSKEKDYDKIVAHIQKYW